MGILKIKSKDFELELVTDDNGVCSVKNLEGGFSPTADVSVDVALIALALESYNNSKELHDEESGRITILPHRSEWSSKSFGLNKGINKH